MDKLAEIRRLYYQATKETIRRDLARAIEILKTMPDEEERERASVYMEGLTEMRAEWGQRKRRSKP
jgi:hypothetical protein